MSAFFFSRPVLSWTGLRLGHVLRVLVLACGLSLVSEAVVAGGYVKLTNTNGYVYGYYGTGDQACFAGVSFVDMTGLAAPLVYVSSAGVCRDSKGISTGLSVAVYSTGTPPITCTSPQVLQTDSSGKYVCAAPVVSCPAVGQSAPGGNTANGTSSTQTIINPQVCVSGCAYTYSSYWTGAKPGQSGGYPAQYTGLQSTGNSCDGSGTPTASMPVPPTPDNPCTQRQYYGTVNGQPKCVDYPTNTTGGTTSSTTTDASVSSPPASSSSTTTSSTTCDGTTCTTTTVVGGGGGGVGGGPGGNGGASGVSASPCATGQVSTGAQVNGGPGTCTTTTTQPQDEYCKQNPTADQCGNKSQWGGDCTAGFTCKGDAVVCAISQVQYKQYCDAQALAHAQIGKAFFGNDTLSPDESQLEAEMKALNPQDKTTGKGDNDIDVGSKWQAAVNDVSKKLTVFGGASCPAGNTITFMGITVVVPYDIMCQFATVIRGFVTLAAAMVCLRIFGRSD